MTGLLHMALRVQPLLRSVNGLLPWTSHYHVSSSLSQGSNIASSTSVSGAKRSTESVPVINFDDTKVAYASKSIGELVRALLVFRLCSYDFLVDNNKKLMQISRRLLGKRLFRSLMRSTFYGQFVAGEDQVSIKPLIRKNRNFGVKSILDYSVEDDIPEEVAVRKVKEGLQEVIADPIVRPAAATVQYQTSVQFADRSKEVVSARTYFYESERQCDRNMNTFIESIDAVTGSTNNEGFAAIKLTAMGRPQLLLQMSDFLMQMRSFFNLLVGYQTEVPTSLRKIDKESFKRRLEELGVEISYDDHLQWFTLLDTSADGHIDLLDWSHLKNFELDLARIFRVRNLQTGNWEQLVPTLTEEGLTEMRNMIHRIDTIARHAQKTGVRVMVDAEQSYLQPAIRRIVMEMMRRFNKEKAVIFNTYQCYLKEAHEHIVTDLTLAEQENFYFGAKLVRGAYMEQERKRAAELGYEDPINPTFDSTSKMYETVLDEVFRSIQRRPRGYVAVMVASHNEDTVRRAIEMMAQYNVRPDDRLICFGQLLGMCDQISFSLGHSGYSVYKYVPYGPVDEVLPYLSRRAMENKGVIAKVMVERALVWKEIKRRLWVGQILHSPLRHAAAR